MGEGPSVAIAPWQHARRHLQQVLGHMPDLCLIGHHAVGTSYSTAQYAVASGLSRLQALHEKGVIKRGVSVVCNHPEKMGDVPELVELLSHETTQWAPARWPNMAAGPLAIWAMAAMGYETIYLYGLDGTADNREPTDADRETLRRYRKRAHVWEGQILMVHRARNLPGSEPGTRPVLPTFVRVWPWECRWRKAEPLAAIVSETLRVPAEKPRDPVPDVRTTVASTPED